MQVAVAEAPTQERRPLALWLVPMDMRLPALRKVSARLGSVVERSRGRWSMDTLCNDILTDRMQLWLICDDDVRGVVLTELATTETGMKICNILGATGDGAQGWLHLIGDLETWARSEGCHRIEAWARKGWARRLPDYAMTHVKLEKDLL